MRNPRWYHYAADAAAWIAIAAVSLIVCGHCAGCGGATAETRTSYAVEQARCLANERTIVDRAGSTLEEDREALELERTRCDAALRSIAP